MSEIVERLARIEEHQTRTKEELEEVCIQLSGPDGQGGKLGAISKRLWRLEFYLALAIGAGTVVAWVLDRAVNVAMIVK